MGKLSSKPVTPLNLKSSMALPTDTEPQPLPNSGGCVTVGTIFASQDWVVSSRAMIKCKQSKERKQWHFFKKNKDLA